MFFSTLQIPVRCIRSSVLRPGSVKAFMKVQRYSNWVHRRPVAVINEEIVLDSAEEAPKPRKHVLDENHIPLKTKRKRQINKPQPVEVSNQTYKEDGSLNITKSENIDRNLMTLMMNVKSKKLREKNKQILIEGHRQITDAIKAGIKLQILIGSRMPDMLKLELPKEDVQIFKVPYKSIQLWSSLTTPPGLIGIFEMPETTVRPLTADTIPLTIICDNIREPGNLGSILRAAAGAGCENVILTKGCVDVWDPKVLRSSSGAHFRVSFVNNLEWEDVRRLISPTAKVYAADNNVFVTCEESTESQVDSEVCSDSPFLKLSSDIEETINEEENQSPEDCKLLVDDETSQRLSRRPQKSLLKELASQIPVVPYYATDYTSHEVALIVGGETEGLSAESIELLSKKQGVRINVPLSNEMESLNTAMALGIITYEVRRQFAQKRSFMAYRYSDESVNKKQ